MARHRAGVREDEGEGKVEAGLPQSSPLMKLAMRPKNSPIGVTTAARSSMASALKDARTREEHDGEHRAEEAAVERHAALPDREDLGRAGEIGVEIVEQHVADAAAEDDAERHPDDQIVDVGRARLPEAGPVFGRRGEAPGIATSRRRGRRYRRARTSGSPAGRWRRRSGRSPETAAPGGLDPCRWV